MHIESRRRIARTLHLSVVSLFAPITTQRQAELAFFIIILTSVDNFSSSPQHFIINCFSVQEFFVLLDHRSLGRGAGGGGLRFEPTHSSCFLLFIILSPSLCSVSFFVVIIIMCTTRGEL